MVGGSLENEPGVFEAYQTPGEGQLEREWRPGGAQRRLGAFLLPVAPITQQACLQNSARGKGTGYTERKIKISVIDDSSPNC